MNVGDMNWFQVEEHLKADPRAVVPLGSTEQHAYLSNCVDAILAERMAREAATPSNALVFPVLPYGITPYFAAFPGTITLRMETYAHIIHDVLYSLHRGGARHVVFVNGHGGNNPGQTAAMEWMTTNPGVRVAWHNWWNAPRTMARVREIDPLASHASWMENFPWTRLGNIGMPDEQKPMIDIEAMRSVDPWEARALLGDGNFGGYYQRSDEEMQSIWDVGVEETRAVIEGEDA